jgi:hypothetical protein
MPLLRQREKNAAMATERLKDSLSRVAQKREEEVHIVSLGLNLIVDLHNVRADRVVDVGGVDRVHLMISPRRPL